MNPPASLFGNNGNSLFGPRDGSVPVALQNKATMLENNIYEDFNEGEVIEINVDRATKTVNYKVNGALKLTQTSEILGDE